MLKVRFVSFMVILLLAIGATTNASGATSTSVKTDATFVGWADGNSFEVIVNKKPIVIRVLDSNRGLVKNVAKGDVVTLTYWVNVKKQNILGNTFAKKITTSRITYTGLIDNHSFEGMLNNKPIVFRLTEKTLPLVSKLKTKAPITITYSTNIQGQYTYYVLQNVAK